LTTEICSIDKGIGCIISYFTTEIEMINELIRIVNTEDPDILVGFEVDNKSWGYVENRYNILKTDPTFDFCTQINRNNCKVKTYHNPDAWISRESSRFQVHGRIVFNLWRIYQNEVSLRYYTLQELYRYYFNKTIVNLSDENLISLMKSDYFAFLKYALTRLNAICDLATKTPFLIKSVEFSRLLGIDIFSTLTRGSQYRVESILITAAHSENFLLRTPTEADVRNMRAAQGLPLTMEPISNYYKDPIVILDFQSLYPSMIIAYNFCYSTIIGSFQDEKVVSCGAMMYPSPGMYNWNSFSQISDYDTFEAPGGIRFVRKKEKNGLLPRLLNEILSTRVAIKNAMKSCDSVYIFFKIEKYNIIL
jgi:DNA polymerase zeta